MSGAADGVRNLFSLPSEILVDVLLRCSPPDVACASRAHSVLAKVVGGDARALDAPTCADSFWHRKWRRDIARNNGRYIARELSPTQRDDYVGERMPWSWYYQVYARDLTPWCAAIARRFPSDNAPVVDVGPTYPFASAICRVIAAAGGRSADGLLTRLTRPVGVSLVVGYFAGHFKATKEQRAAGSPRWRAAGDFFVCHSTLHQYRPRDTSATPEHIEKWMSENMVPGYRFVWYEVASPLTGKTNIHEQEHVRVRASLSPDARASFEQQTQRSVYAWKGWCLRRLLVSSSGAQATLRAYSTNTDVRALALSGTDQPGLQRVTAPGEVFLGGSALGRETLGGGIVVYPSGHVLMGWFDLFAPGSLTSAAAKLSYNRWTNATDVANRCLSAIAAVLAPDSSAIDVAELEAAYATMLSCAALVGVPVSQWPNMETVSPFMRGGLAPMTIALLRAALCGTHGVLDPQHHTNLHQRYGIAELQSFDARRDTLGGAAPELAPTMPLSAADRLYGASLISEIHAAVSEWKMTETALTTPGQLLVYPNGDAVCFDLRPRSQAMQTIRWFRCSTACPDARMAGRILRPGALQWHPVCAAYAHEMAGGVDPDGWVRYGPEQTRLGWIVPSPQERSIAADGESRALERECENDMLMRAYITEGYIGWHTIVRHRIANTAYHQAQKLDTTFAHLLHDYVNSDDDDDDDNDDNDNDDDDNDDDDNDDSDSNGENRSEGATGNVSTATADE